MLVLIQYPEQKQNKSNKLFFVFLCYIISCWNLNFYCKSCDNIFPSKTVQIEKLKYKILQSYKF